MLTITGIGAYCSYSCALSHAIEIRDSNRNTTPVTGDSISMLRGLYMKSVNMYKEENTIPDEKISTTLLPSPHWSLLKNNGGDLTPEEYYSTEYSFRPRYNSGRAITSNISSYKLSDRIIINKINVTSERTCSDINLVYDPEACTDEDYPPDIHAASNIT